MHNSQANSHKANFFWSWELLFTLKESIEEVDNSFLSSKASSIRGEVTSPLARYQTALCRVLLSKFHDEGKLQATSAQTG